MDGVTGTAAVVTGAASGIGEALVRRLCDAGGSVLAVDLDADGLARLAEETECATMVADVGFRLVNEAVVSRAERLFDKLNFAFLNAGILDRPIESLSDEFVIGSIDWTRYDKVRGVLLDGVIHGTVAATESMAESGGGSIVATASAAGLVPWPPTPVYSAAKHAVVGWVRSSAPALAHQGVRINAICPGGIATPLLGRQASDAAVVERLLSPDQVAAAMIEIAVGDSTGEAWSIVANREPALQRHEFTTIPDFP